MKLNVLLLPGDGIGVEVTREAAKILNHIAGVFRRELFIREGSLGGIAIHKTGTPFPDETQTLALEADATLMGAVGLPESLLPIVVPRDAHAALFSAIAKDPAAIVTVDLATQTLALPDGSSVQFPIDGFSKHRLLNGVDELGYILHQEPFIAAYEARAVGQYSCVSCCPRPFRPSLC